MISRFEKARRPGQRLVKRFASRLDFGLLVVLLLPVFVILPLSQPGLPRTADGFLHLSRLVEVDQNWQAGIYYPRWAPDMAFGYGYPIFNYFAPLLYELTEVMHLLGFGLQASLKLVLIGCILLGAWGMYALAKDLLGAKPAILAAATYVYAPYMLRDNFVRGAYAEFLALSLMPAALWSFNRLLASDNPMYLATSPLLCGAVILSHNISGMLFLPLLVLFVAWTTWSLRRWGKMKEAGLALLLALTLAAVFWVPALVEKPLVKLDKMIEGHFDFRQHFLSLQEVLSPSRVPDSASFNPVWLHNLGTAQLILAGLGLVAAIVGPLMPRQRTQAVLFLVVLVVSVFMTLPVSRPVWERVSLLAFTEFPWRFLGTAVLASCFLAGMSVNLWSSSPWRHAGIAFLMVSLLFTVLTVFVHLYVRWPPPREDELSVKDVVLHESRTGHTIGAGECLPIWVVEEPTDSPLVSQYLSSGSIRKLDEQSLPDFAQAEPIRHTVVSDEYRFLSPEPFTVQFNTIYFPGWIALVDGEPVPITPSHPRGLITVEVPAGEHTVAVRFGDTPVRTLAGIVSGMGLLFMIGLTAFRGLRARGRRGADSEAGQEARLPFSRASVLVLAIIALLLVKIGFIDTHTTWFRKRSPPGQVLGVQHPRSVSLSEGVRFLGYDVSSEAVKPGDTLSVTLYWEAQRRLRENYSVFLHLDDLRANYISWSLSEETNPAGFPTSTWTPGFYVSNSHQLSISAETPPGLYVLRAGMYRVQSGERLPVLEGESNVVADSIELGRIRVRRTIPVSLSGVTTAGPFTFGDQLKLLGYRLEETSTTPGNYFRLVLYWQASKEISQSYTVFVHLVDNRGQTWAQADGLPMNGMYPTWAWLREEIVTDEHLIPLEAAVPPGRYQLAVGIYELETLRRLQVSTADGSSLGDQVLLQTPVEVITP